MKPLNSKERAKAYQKVVGFFVICFALAMILGFTTMNVNKLTDSKTKSDLERLQAQLRFQEDVFAPNIDDVTSILTSIPASREAGENIDVLNSTIASKISETLNRVPEDENWETNMYKNVLKVYSGLQLSYRDQLRMSDELEVWRNSTAGSDKELQRCLDEKRALQTEINLLKLAGGAAAGGGGGGGNLAQLEQALEKTRKELDDCNKVNTALRSEINKLRNR